MRIPPHPVLSLLLAALLLGAAALAPAGATAATDQRTYFEAPRELRDAAAMPGALDELSSLGVRAVRQVLYWRDVAPAAGSATKPDFDTTDPAAYSWGQYDAIVNAVKARGWKLLLTVSGPVPRWATEAKKDQVTRPDAAEFTAFMTAVARHYGAKVDVWSIWNEPNQPQFLKPQYDSRHHPYSPRLYRKLYRGALKAFDTEGMTPTLLFGETSPRGTGKVVAPLTFLRGALCLSKNYKRSKSCGRLPAAGIAHHAYTTRKGPFFKPDGPNDVTIGVLSRLTRAVDRAGRAGAIPKGLPIWLTEFGIQSTPDPLYGVSEQQQAEYRAISERIAYDNPRVKAFSQYLLRDDDPIKGVPKLARYGGFESGLRTAGGKAKTSLGAFRLPLVVRHLGARRASLWGLVRPATGATTAVLEYRDGRRGAFRTLQNVTTGATGYFSVVVAYRKGRQYRLTWTPAGGAARHGGPTRAYSAP
jgi:hypothetical protein